MLLLLLLGLELLLCCAVTITHRCRLLKVPAWGVQAEQAFEHCVICHKRKLLHDMYLIYVYV
jgi:hypothetical protein